MSETVKRKALKGFADLGFFLISKNDKENYAVTPEKLALGVGARSCTRDETREEYQIPGDDGIYAMGSDYKFTTLNVSVNEIELETLGTLLGADYDNATKVLRELANQTAPEIAMVFSMLRMDQSKRMFKYFAVTLTNYTHDGKALLDTGNEVNQYTLTFQCKGRDVDGAVRDTKDSEIPAPGQMADISWLDTIEAVAPSGG